MRIKEYTGEALYPLISAEGWIELAIEDAHKTDSSDSAIKNIAIKYLNALLNVCNPNMCHVIGVKIRALLADDE